MGKKAIFMVLLLAGTFMTAQAQYSDMYYHHVGDTVEWDTQIGFYSWWEWEAFYQNELYVWMLERQGWGQEFLDSGILLQYFYTPVPLKIIGIAGCCIRGRGYLPTVLDTNEVEEYLLIYDAGPGDTFTQVSATKWTPFDPVRYIHVLAHAPEQLHPDSCCGYGPTEFYIPIKEYYFDSAIWVTDSFYVGGSFFGNQFGPNPSENIMSIYTTADLYGRTACNSDFQEITNPGAYQYCTFPSVVYKRRGGFPSPPFHADGWTWLHHPINTLLIYPIIEVDTTVPPRGTCREVENVQAVVSGTTATVSWDYFPNYTSLTLRYGVHGTPQHLWQALDVTDLSLTTLSGLNPATFYSVSLQAMCDKNEMPWSAPVSFYTGIDTTADTTSAIDTPSPMAAQTFVQPNPAHDRVTVSSVPNLSRIDIYTSAGVLVYSEPAVGHRSDIDITFLRSGTYIVAIHTHRGITHKKLIVNR
mgnify:CR=1 FL=1